MKYVLLVWAELPEEVKLYLIPEDVAKPVKHYLEQAQNKYLNSSDEENDGLRFLNTALAEEVAVDGFEEHLGKFRQFKQELYEPITEKTITEVYYSGFVL